ncbi:MAG TPA: TAXI family TRAP transporter solute-binding subunit, partial [Pseudonocardia sp.]|nr:TAXI family TRAP transporter solute-binding subunit [Pseudonocardia sp.]
GTQGVYYAMGTALAEVWRERLGLGEAPVVVPTAGSVANLDLLGSGGADVAFSQVDTAADRLATVRTGDPRAPRALARIYDDVVQVVVRASAPITTLDDLRGARVSVGARDSGVFVVAGRLLAAAGVDVDRDLRAVRLGINESVDALYAGEIDAFFWSGGLPTAGVRDLARALPIRLLDLEDVLVIVRDRHPVYASRTVPATSYDIGAPVTTVAVRNVLLVTAAMPADLAGALVDALFAARPQLAQVNPLALTIVSRAAIGTQPVPLHPGAEGFYRASKQV